MEVEVEVDDAKLAHRQWQTMADNGTTKNLPDGARTQFYLNNGVYCSFTTCSYKAYLYRITMVNDIISKQKKQSNAI